MVSLRPLRLSFRVGADVSAMPMTRGDLPRTELVLLPVAPAVQAQQTLSVEFESPDGRSWTAIGGGDTVAAAIEWARESCPRGTNWEARGWEDLYGE
jgi:hypothetical protein